MPKIRYVSRRFSSSSRSLIASANTIIEDYQAAGYKLTLRQLYYQFVSRDLLPNTVQSYKKLGSVINDARLAGLIDWDSIEDRTRNLSNLAHWYSPKDIVVACAKLYRIDMWKEQPYRVEVWIEKEALAGVFERICQTWDVPFLCCRGYTSQSEMWAGAMRLLKQSRIPMSRGIGEPDRYQKTVILHFGDHDPSGIDMSRDIQDRLAIFGCNPIFKRLALNMDQIEQYNPPPNPAKETDSRFESYLREYGDESWELDALDPRTLSDLVDAELNKLIDENAWSRSAAEQDTGREQLTKVSRSWNRIVRSLEQ